MERIAHLILKLAAVVVPRDRRDEWTEEWRAEVWHQLRGYGRPEGPAPGWTVAVRCVGAFPHAVWIRIGRWSMGRMWTNLKLAARGVRRDPAFAGPAILVFAIAVGSAATLFASYEAVVLRPLTYENPESLVSVWAEHPERGWYQEYVAPANLFDWREQVAAFDDVAGYGQDAREMILVEDGRAEVVDAAPVTGNMFDLLGAAPASGRTFRMEETWSDTDPVTVLTHDFWMQRFGGDPDVLGRRIELSGVGYEVVGIMPADFRYLVPNRDLWVTFRWAPDVRGAAFFRRAHLVRAVARLGDDVDRSEAEIQLRTVAGRLAEAYPSTNEGLTAGTTPLADYLVGDRVTTLRALLAGVGLLLLAACVNVGYLITVRWRRRSMEVALRRALGAGTTQLTENAALESLVVSTAGTALGLLSSVGGMRLLAALAPPELLAAADLRLSAPVLAGAAGTMAVAALVFTLLPVMASRDARSVRVIGRATRSAVGGRRAVGIRGFVVLQVALSAVLVSSAALLARSFVALRSVDPGFTAAGVLSFAVPFPDGSDEAAPDRLRLAAQIERDLYARAGVVAVGSTRRLPVLGNGWTSFFSTEGSDPGEGSFEIVHRGTTPGYFDAMRVALVGGRLFAADETDAVVINETFARRAFPSSGAIGRRIAFTEEPSESSRWFEIVGVVADERQNGLRADARPEVFTPIAFDVPSTFRFVVRTSGNPTALVEAAREVVRGVDSGLPLDEIADLEGVVSDSLARDRFVALVSAAFALLAGLLAVTGVYGVTAQAAAGWQREFAVRLAVGARPGSLFRVVLSRGLATVGTGVVLGMLGAVWATGFLEGFLFETSPLDPGTLVASALLVAAAGAAASLPSALRAMRTDPARSLGT
jgi:predicted permease